jgi:hypothetical protein
MKYLKSLNEDKENAITVNKVKDTIRVATIE